MHIDASVQILNVCLFCCSFIILINGDIRWINKLLLSSMISISIYWKWKYQFQFANGYQATSFILSLQKYLYYYYYLKNGIFFEYSNNSSYSRPFFITSANIWASNDISTSYYNSKEIKDKEVPKRFNDSAKLIFHNEKTYKL